MATIPLWLMLSFLVLGKAYILPPYGNWSFTSQSYHTTIREESSDCNEGSGITPSLPHTSNMYHGTGPVAIHSTYHEKVTHTVPLWTGTPPTRAYHNTTRATVTPPAAYGTITRTHWSAKGYRHHNKTQQAPCSNLTTTPGTWDQHTVPYHIPKYPSNLDSRGPTVPIQYSGPTISGYDAKPSTYDEVQSLPITSEYPHNPPEAYTTLISTIKTQYQTSIIEAMTYA